MKYPKIKTVTPMPNYHIVFTYDSGETRRFDVKPYIKGTWYGALKDENTFKTVHPCGDTVEWEGGQDIAPHELNEYSELVSIRAWDPDCVKSTPQELARMKEAEEEFARGEYCTHDEIDWE